MNKGSLREFYDSNPKENEIPEFLSQDISNTYNNSVTPSFEPIFAGSIPNSEKFVDQYVSEGDTVRELEKLYASYAKRKIPYIELRARSLPLLKPKESLSKNLIGSTPKENYYDPQPIKSIERQWHNQTPTTSQRSIYKQTPPLHEEIRETEVFVDKGVREIEVNHFTQEKIKKTSVPAFEEVRSNLNTIPETTLMVQPRASLVTKSSINRKISVFKASDLEEDVETPKLPKQKQGHVIVKQHSPEPYIENQDFYESPNEEVIHTNQEKRKR